MYNILYNIYQTDSLFWDLPNCFKFLMCWMGLILEIPLSKDVIPLVGWNGLGFFQVYLPSSCEARTILSRVLGTSFDICGREPECKPPSTSPTLELVPKPTLLGNLSGTISQIANQQQWNWCILECSPQNIYYIWGVETKFLAGALLWCGIAKATYGTIEQSFGSGAKPWGYDQRDELHVPSLKKQQHKNHKDL